MPTRTVEKEQISIENSQERVGEHIGVFEIETVLDDDGEKRGYSLSLSVGKIALDDVALEVTQYLEDGKEEGYHEILVGVEEPNNATLYFDTEGTRHDWQGTGFSRYNGHSGVPSWPSFGPIRHGAKRMADQDWSVGSETIIRRMRGGIESEVEDPEIVAKIYGTTYFRFNRLITNSYREEIKAHKRQSAALGEVLLIDEVMQEKAVEELAAATAYADFTRQHIRINRETKDAIDAGPASSPQPVVEMFEANRKIIKEAHTLAFETCSQMLDSIYMPSGFRFGAGRTWPYMDIGQYDFEIGRLREGNFGHVIREIDRETQEIDYKFRELISPDILTLRALSGETDLRLYG